MKFKGLQTLDWYIIRKFLTTFFMSLLLIVGIVIIFDVSERIEDFVRREAPLHAIIFDYYLNYIPYFMNMYSPMFVFLTVIIFTSKMTQDSEIIAILSSGISYHRMVVPYMVSAVFIALLSLGLGLWVIPKANGPRVEFEQNTFQEPRPIPAGTCIISWRTTVTCISSRSAAITIPPIISRWKISVTASSIPSCRPKVPSTTRLRACGSCATGSSGIIPAAWKTVSAPAGRWIRCSVLPGTTSSGTNTPSSAWTRESWTSLSKRKTQRGDASVSTALIEKNNRFSLPFSAIILTIIGLSLSTKKKRGGMGWNLAAGLALGFSYILFMQFSEMFVMTDTLPASIAIWLPNYLYAVIAAVLYIKAPK